MFRYYTPYAVDLYSIPDTETIQAYMDRVRALPEAIKKVLTDFSTAEYLIDIVVPEFRLEESGATELTRITRDILLGDLFIGDMSVSIANKLNVEQTTAQQIRDKITNELFAPAVEDIKKIQREKFPDRVGQGNINSVPQPPALPQMKNAPAVNQSNVIDLRNQP